MKPISGLTRARKKALAHKSRAATSRAVASQATTSFTFKINGKPVFVEEVAPTTTLLEYLRTHGYTGTKCGCAEGDCGACTVALVDLDAEGKPTYRAINSCIALLPMFADHYR
jgi:xanthine dehydrogenase iron-sulfur cluster and FAD-binding subunit A